MQKRTGQPAASVPAKVPITQRLGKPVQLTSPKGKPATAGKPRPGQQNVKNRRPQLKKKNKKQVEKPALTAEQLDKDMDVYMGEAPAQAPASQ
jgi:hypothetical protein